MFIKSAGIKSLLFYAILFVLTLRGASIAIKKIVQLQSLSVKPQTVFLTKFDIGVGSGNFTIKYRKQSNRGDSDFDKVSLSLGLLKDDHYHAFRDAFTCEQKQKLYSQVQHLSFAQSSWGANIFKVTQDSREHIWYLYLFDCKSQNDKQQLVGAVSMDITMYNNNSHFGEDQNFLLGYVILLIIWVFLVIRFFLPVADSLYSKSTSWTQILIYCGFLFLGLSYFYRLLDLLMIYYYGQRTHFLSYLYIGIKNVVESVMVTVIVSIGWGWSLTHLKHQPYYVIVGTVVTLINLMAIILDNSAQEIEQAHHHYDRLIGIILLLIRIAIFLLFVAGILRCMAESVGKRRHFVKKFGYQGGAFLIAWPVTVIFAQIFLPNHMHNQVVTLVEEGAHIIANAFMCHLFAFPQSDFKKVSMKDDDETLPDYVKK